MKSCNFSDFSWKPPALSTSSCRRLLCFFLLPLLIVCASANELCADTSDTPLLRYEVTPEKEGIQVLGWLKLDAFLINEGDVPVVVHWGDIVFKAHYPSKDSPLVMIVTRARGFSPSAHSTRNSMVFSPG